MFWISFEKIKKIVDKLGLHMVQGHDEGYRKEFCKRFGIKYTGKLSDKIVVTIDKVYSTQYNNIEYLMAEDNKLIIKTLTRPYYYEIGKKHINLHFVDNIINVKDVESANKAIKYFKELKERIKLQNIKGDF